MSPFHLHQPGTLREATSLLGSNDPAVRPMGGGTALMLMMKAGVLKPSALVSLRRIEPRFRAIELRADGELHIGALVTLSQLEHSPEVRRAAPAIGRCMTRLSNVRVRNVATVGGNLAHADPHMDLPPLLAALDASVLVAGPKGERRVPVDALITGYYETGLAPDELITKLVVPPQAGLRSAYIKVTTRSADDWPALGVAASLHLHAGVVRSCRLFVGAATDRPTRLSAAEAVLAGQRVDAATVQRAGDAAAAAADFLSDAQGSASYKKELLRVYLGRVLQAALADSAGSAN
jgi:carbon-monoxide dehydrogenase medium subunit